MRLCRFTTDGVILVGFYADDHVIPIFQASEQYFEATGEQLTLPLTEDLLALLTPRPLPALFELSRWLGGLSPRAYQSLALPIRRVRLLVPIGRPNKIFFLSENYADHALEMGGTAPLRDETFPHIYLKPMTTLADPGSGIVLPRASPDHIDWECELGVVIGRTCRGVDESRALRYVAGYTVVNDVTDRSFDLRPALTDRSRDPFFRWLMGKWHDTFSPVGPCLLCAHGAPDPQRLRLRLTVNGEVKQDASTADMIFPVASIVAFLSRFVTLEPGDLIATGTAAGVGAASQTFLRPGDVVRATVDGIGTLENFARAERPPGPGPR